ncbi:mucin-2-like [Neopsephotus bourkii]|uniref:mucin-2-like n=1 Tax=Neopsephotus bourkii TaxID=309878 RepID=UPI002AA549BF|nr:mucin-2-like [Neopsephotus bourkii]
MSTTHIYKIVPGTKNITALEETTSTQTEANTKTEAAPMSPAWEGSSLKVPPGSEATSPTFPTPRPSTTAISMDTASGTAASLSLQPSSAATTRSSFSSSPVGFTDATTMAQKSSTSENTEAGLAATSHPSVAPMSPASSSTPAATGTGSGTVSTDALTDSPAPSTPSSTTSASTSSMSLVSETTDASLSSTQSGSIKMHALQLTSTSIMQGQAMTEVEATSSSPGTTLAAAATTSDANPDTALPSKVETPNMNEGSGLTTNPNTQMMPSLSATLLVTPSTPPMMEGERKTEAALTSPTWEGSSLEVSARSKVTSATFPTPRPSTTAISMDTASGTAASLSLQPSSATTSHSSFSSSPVGFTDATTMTQKSSTSKNTDMTSVPPESAMARFTRSTANPIFTTTFVSGPCMPMSIKVQNVTGYAIQFSWTGGRRGSLHTISLMDGSREINKTTTNETKTVFEHLLPGHVYTVSVEEQSCAGDSRTSVTVRTDPASCFNRTEFCLPQNTACPDLKYTVCSYYQAFSCSVLLKKTDI